VLSRIGDTAALFFYAEAGAYSLRAASMDTCGSDPHPHSPRPWGRRSTRHFPPVVNTSVGFTMQLGQLRFPATALMTAPTTLQSPRYMLFGSIIRLPSLALNMPYKEPIVKAF
jgi:hypothetical protein